MSKGAMDQTEFVAIVQENLPTFREGTEALNRLTEDLKRSQDMSFTALNDVKLFLNKNAALVSAAKKIRDAAVSRAKAKLSE